MLICYNSDGEIAYNKVTDAAFEHLQLFGELAAELVFASPDEIREVNLRTRGIDKATDVLSFPTLNHPIDLKDYLKNNTKKKAFTRQNYPHDFDPELNAVFLGSVMLCREIAANQAKEIGHSVEREECYLFVHGLLHLFGFDHETEEEKHAMRETEKILMLPILP
ncbi:MAG: rRNA maturation RNase YbeY [Firmicutes bacterium]|nr:rRNA maturation RNase YbeY [Bacillota bacterium]